MRLQRDFMKYWIPVVIWMCFIFWMSTGTFSSEHTSRFIIPLLQSLSPWLSPEDVDLIHELIRKSGHLSEYFILGLLAFRAFRGVSSQKWCLQWTVLAVIVVALFAVSDELHQSLVASRNCSLFDVGIDLAGGILSQGAIYLAGKSTYIIPTNGRG